jgi:HIP---CoA ligase
VPDREELYDGELPMTTARAAAHDAETTDIPPTIPAALVRAARQWPDADALADGSVRLTYRQYLERSVQFARGLIARGVGPGDRVAVWAPNSAEVALTAMAVAFAGGVLVPLNTRFTAYEAAALIRRAEAVAVLAFTGFLGRDYLASLRELGALDGLKAAVALRGPSSFEGALSLPGLLALGEATDEAEVWARVRALEPAGISDILFTSGTTGAPKGAMLRHGASTRAYTEYGRSLGLRHGDRMLGFPPFFHCFGLKAVVLTSVLYGATVLPVPVFDVHQIATLIAAERITVLQGAPLLFQTLLDDPGVDRSSLSSLRVAGPGAMGSSPELYRRLRDELGIRYFSPGYGLTEGTAIGARCYWFDDFETVSTTCGRIAPGIELRLAGLGGSRPGGGAGADVPGGSDGEILLRGYNVMAGYLDDPDATAQAIDADGWLHTGDIGRVDEFGRLTITGRLKDMFLVGGFNTYPAEIEQTLATHDAIADVAVIGVPDARLGEVGMAFVVLRPGATVTDGELTGWARGRLANYKVPRHWRFVSGLQRNASGKVIKSALREQLKEATWGS